MTMCRSETPRCRPKRLWRATTAGCNPCPGDRLTDVPGGTKAARGPGGVTRRDVTKEAELLVLRHENAALPRQLTGPIRYDPEDRLWLAALSSLIRRRRWRKCSR